MIYSSIFIFYMFNERKTIFCIIPHPGKKATQKIRKNLMKVRIRLCFAAKAVIKRIIKRSWN